MFISNTSYICNSAKFVLTGKICVGCWERCHCTSIWIQTQTFSLHTRVSQQLVFHQSLQCPPYHRGASTPPSRDSGWCEMHLPPAISSCWHPLGLREHHTLFHESDRIWESITINNITGCFTHVSIFVFIYTMKVEWLSIDKKLCSLHFHSPEPNWLTVNIFTIFHLQRSQYTLQCIVLHNY